MQIISKSVKQRLAGLAVVLAIMGAATLAHAIPINQVLRKGDIPTFTGKCCFSFDQTVTVTEPATITPVVVSFSTDYQANDVISVGIAVNGHPCQDTYDVSGFGPSYFRARALEWVVLPSDGLIKGSNTITLCGGGTRDTDTLTLGFRTMLVTVSK